jgi:hypothetical protein
MIKLRVALFGLVAASLGTGSVAVAKRLPPADVLPVIIGDVRYEVPHFNNPCGQNGGCVVAYANATNDRLWAVKVYCTQYDSHVEADTQDVFIISLTPKDGHLIVANEKGLQFDLDPQARTVTGDTRGCSSDSGGCGYAGGSPHPINGAFWLGLGLAVSFAVRRLRAPTSPRVGAAPGAPGASSDRRAAAGRSTA